MIAQAIRDARPLALHQRDISPVSYRALGYLTKFLHAYRDTEIAIVRIVSTVDIAALHWSAAQDAHKQLSAV